MSTIDCCRGLPRPVREYFDPREGEISLQEVEARLQPQADAWQASDASRDFWTRWARVEQEPRPLAALLASKFEGEGVARGTAVDLGCGNGRDVLGLVASGWDVFAVDCNRTALDIVKEKEELLKVIVAAYNRQNPQQPLRPGTLTTVESSIENYRFPRGKVEMVLAIDSLNYCDPGEMLHIWNRAHAALKPGGRVICSLPRAPIFSFMSDLTNRVTPSWYADPAFFRALLRKKGYEVEAFDYPGRGVFCASSMLAIGKKV